MNKDEVEVYWVKIPERKSIRMTRTGFEALNRRRPGLYAIREKPEKIVIPVHKPELVKVPKKEFSTPKSKTRKSKKP